MGAPEAGQPPQPAAERFADGESNITNPSLDSTLPYFRGKAEVEARVRDSGLSYAIVRPAVLFGGAEGEDILLNNIAWIVRHLRLFAIPGAGIGRVRPVHVEDLAAFMHAQGRRRADVTVDAVGPETFTLLTEWLRGHAATIGAATRPSSDVTSADSRATQGRFDLTAVTPETNRTCSRNTTFTFRQQT